MTAQQILEERIKCAKNPVYFLNNYGYVFDAVEKRVRKMKCFEYQEKCVDIFHKNQNSIILKSRQTGLSVITAGYVAWRLMFRYDERILIVANDGNGAERFLDTVKQFIQNTPQWLQPDSIILNNRRKLVFSNGSWVQAKASSPDAGRGDSLTMLVLDETAFIKDAEAIWMAAGMALSATKGKCIMISCVPKGTFVFTDKGVKKIDEFVVDEKRGGYEIEEYKVFGKDKLRTGNLFFNNGFHDTRLITTTNAQVEGTLNHKLWACKNGIYDWYKMGELEVGDFVSVQYGMETWGNNDSLLDFVPSYSNKMSNKFSPQKIDKDLAYLIGLYISEGSVYKKYNDNGEFIGGNVTITCGDDVSKSIESLGLSYSCHDGLHYSIGSKNLIELLEYLGFDLSKKAKEKEIPSRVLEMSRENIIYMLRGIFDGDGYSRKDNGYIGINMNSKVLVQQIRMLLLNFGILTDYCEVWTKPTEKVKKETLNYRISANGEFSKIFYEKIGFEFERKQINESILNKYNLERNNPNDVVPFSLDVIKEMIKESGFKPSDFKKNGIFINSILNKKTEYKTQHISRGLFLKIFYLCKELISEELKLKIGRMLSENLKWNVITSIKENKKETYDFSLPDNEEDFWAHSVLYNGVLGHQTPNGTGNLYHKTWVGGTKKENDFVPLTVHWTQNPQSSVGLEYQKNASGEEIPWSPWYEEQCRRMNYDSVKIAQELDLSFEGSKYLVIEQSLIDKYEKKTRGQKPNFYIRYDFAFKGMPQSGSFVLDETSFHVWKRPEQGRHYIVGVDVSRGDGKDYSTIQVFDIETLEQVAEYRDKVGVDLFPYLIDWVGRAYNNAYLVVECNTFGLGVAFTLRDTLKYSRMFYSKNVQDIHVRSTSDYKVPEGVEIPGFQTTQKTRPLVVMALINHLRENNLIIHSPRLTAEFGTFVMVGNKPQHEPGYNDDLIFAAALALYIRDTEYSNVIATDSMYKSMLGAISFSTSSTVGRSSDMPIPKFDNNLPEGGCGLFLGNQGIQTDDEGLDWLLK